MNTGTPLPASGLVPLADVTPLPVAEFRQAVVEGIAAGARLAAFFGSPAPADRVRLFAIVADDAAHRLSVLRTEVGDSYPSLTPDCAQAHLFEREIAEQWGVHPDGHPWLKPVRFPGEGQTVGVTDFFQVRGEEVHEVAVGPVHAGIIEPGHFRFQCHGEVVLHLEISLGYQYRGIEGALAGGPTPRSAFLAETAAGDTTIGHATAHCRILESLSGRPVPPRAEALRSVALELERLANHAGDLGALANDVGFLPTSAWFGRIRGDFLNTTAVLCGSRFGRSLVRPGGVRFDVDEARRADVIRRLGTGAADMLEPAKLLWNTASVSGRFENTGTVSRDTCIGLGLVGVAARACGVARDVRADHPWGTYRDRPFPVATWPRGDVFSRALVRYYEMKTSAEHALDLLGALPAGPVESPAPPDMRLEPDSLALALVEGWRGEICHAGVTDASGRFATYKIVDPSFHNWMGLAMALRNEQISDFPLCNKSFNLSYCGHDL